MVRREERVPVRDVEVVDVETPLEPLPIAAVVASVTWMDGLDVVAAAGASIPQTEQKPSSMVPVHPGWGHFID